MDELAAIQTFRPTRVPDPHAAAAARSALLTAIAVKPRRLTRPRLLLACALLAGAAATAASASGLGERLLDFVVGEPAPPPVKRQFDLQSRAKAVVPWLERHPGSDVIASKARGVLAIETSVGPVYLWVAPTRGGGFCYLIDVAAQKLRVGSHGGSLGCSPRAPSSDDPFVTGPAQGGGIRRRGYLRLLDGRVSPSVASVELRFANGDSAELRPVDGFYLRELFPDEELTLVIARDRNGTELGRRTMRRLLPPRRELPRPVGPYRTVIELETSYGYPMILTVAPGANGTVCTQTRYRGARAGGCGRRPDADKIWVGHGLWNEAGDDKPVLVLQGSVGSSIARLELEYRDGGSVEIPIVEGHVLFELRKDREPRTLVGRNADGSVVARRRLR